MSEEKPKGNPNWKKGFVANPKGRGKGTLNGWNNKVKGTLNKHRRNPIEELINLADLAKANKDYELAADIWQDIQQYMEPKRKAVEVHDAPQTPQEAKENVEATLKMLEELSDGRQAEGSSDTPLVDNGTAEVAPKTSTEEDLRGDLKQ